MRKGRCCSWGPLASIAICVLACAVIILTIFPPELDTAGSASPESAPVAAEKPAAVKPVVDEKAGTVTIPAVVAEQGKYFDKLKGSIEYVLVARGGKAYETVFVTDADPLALDAALRKLGLETGKPAADDSPPTGAPVKIFAEFSREGKKERRAVDELVAYKKTGKALTPTTWTVTGSRKSIDPESGGKVLESAVTKSIIGLHYTDPSPLIQNSRAEARTENIYKTNLDLLPEKGTAVTLVFEKPRAAPGTIRVHAFLSGRVQGVGFRAFTQREARKLELTGWVKNLPDGRVETVIEGPEAAVTQLLAKLKRGPRAARVSGLEKMEEPARATFRDFTIER